ncbi:hypothetical protein J7J26_00260 [Candidatus Micrarchaeota archaeon]|nr:hypothetical protein [Candidatus Micrarchaeota archaeon]
MDKYFIDKKEDIRRQEVVRRLIDVKPSKNFVNAVIGPSGNMKYLIVLGILSAILLMGCTGVKEQILTPAPQENDNFLSVWMNNKTLLFDENDIDKDSVTFKQLTDLNRFDVSFNLNKEITFDCVSGQDNYVEIKFNDEIISELKIDPSICGISQRSYAFSTDSYDDAYAYYNAILYEK